MGPQQKSIFPSHRGSRESIRLSHRPALQGNFLFLLPCLKMKRKVPAIENSPAAVMLVLEIMTAGSSYRGKVIQVPFWLSVSMAVKMKCLFGGA